MATFTGMAGNDTITPTTISSGVLVDPPGAFPSAATDWLYGGAGNDALNGGTGNDTLDGGAGDDLYLVFNAEVAVSEDDDEGGDAGGLDTVRSSVGWALGAFLENLHLRGTAVTGTGNELDNAITGNEGHNLLRGRLGNDTLAGGRGDDTLFGGDGNDTLLGGLGADELRGKVGNDTLFGGAGHDVLFGGIGTNTLDGGRGNDLYIVYSAGDVVSEDDGAGGDPGGRDTVLSGVSFTLGAFLENLDLGGTAVTGTGNELDNEITGNGGDNTLVGELGDDTLAGGRGDDELSGGDGHDTLYGGQGADELRGKVGNDTLFGGAGHDFLDGASGDDTLYGGRGNDLYFVDSAGDVVSEDDGTGGDPGGRDTVHVSFSWTLGAFLENLNLRRATSAVTGTGNELGNVIEGGSGDDTLIGQGGDDALFGVGGANELYGGDGNDWLGASGGDDTLYGGAGDDFYTVTSVGDLISEDDGEGGDAGGSDTVYSSVDWTLGDLFENLTVYAHRNVTGTGNKLDNLISAWGGDDTLFGLAGNDTLYGGQGADDLRGGDGNDTLYGGTDDRLGGMEGDSLYGGDGNDSLTGGEGADVLSGGLGNDTLTGGPEGGRHEGPEGDSLYGGGGNDTLTGGKGADVLSGGLGNDTLTGGADADLFVFGPGLGQDRVTLFRDGADRIDLIGGLIFSDLTLSSIAGGVRASVTAEPTHWIDLLGVNLGQVTNTDFV